MPERSSNSVRVFYPAHSRDELIAILRQRVALLGDQLPIARAVLFGSQAKGNATAFSDIDLLIVYAGPPVPDAYRIVWRAMHLRGIEPHVYSEAEAEAVKPVIERMTRDGVDLMASSA